MTKNKQTFSKDMRMQLMALLLVMTIIKFIRYRVIKLLDNGDDNNFNESLI